MEELNDEQFLRKYYGECIFNCGCKDYKSTNTYLKIVKGKNKYHVSPVNKEAHDEECRFHGESIKPSIEEKDNLNLIHISTTRKRKNNKTDGSKERKPKTKKNKIRRERKSHYGALSYIMLKAWRIWNYSKCKGKMKNTSFENFLDMQFDNYTLSKLKKGDKYISIKKAKDSKMYMHGILEKYEIVNDQRVKLYFEGYTYPINAEREHFEKAINRYRGNVNNGKFFIGAYLKHEDYKFQGKTKTRKLLHRITVIRIASNESIPVDSKYEADLTDLLIKNNYYFYKPFESIGKVYNQWIPDFVIIADDKRVIVEVFGLKDYDYTLRKEEKIDKGNEINKINNLYLFTSIDKPEKEDRILIERIECLLN